VACDFCRKCDIKNCPKGRGRELPVEKTIGVSASVAGKLDMVCKKNSLMKGDDYYKVPDYSAAIKLLIRSYKG